jgi:maltose/maltodextrin transport system substrate-binding protein/arabinogalactan oligomer/maltooligosaccharide transport system substrate-binding protein
MKFKPLALGLVCSLALVGFGAVAAQDTPTLTIWADEITAPTLQDIGDDFADEYGVEVVVQQIPFNDIRGQFVQTAPTGEGPDIVVGAHDWLGELTSNGLLSPVDLSAVSENLNANAIDAFTYTGEVYGLPYAVDNVAFFRNTDLVPEAPATWDEVRQIAETLSEDDIYGYVIQQRDPWHSYSVMSAFGGYVFGFEEGVGYNACDVGLDSEGAVAAYTYLGDLAADGLMPLSLQQEAMWSLFTEGEAAMMLTGSWALETLRASDVPFAISAPPDGPGGPARPFLSARGFMISSFAEDPILAQTFLTEFVATDDTMQQLFDAESRPPAWLNVEITDEAVAAFTEAAANGAPQPSIPEMGAVWDSWSNEMELCLADPASCQSEAELAASQVRTAIGDVCTMEEPMAEATEASS